MFAKRVAQNIKNKLKYLKRYGQRKSAVCDEKAVCAP